MESRQDQLKKQIINALKKNDSDLYSHLKLQWAHRFGVESLEELRDLELDLPDQNSTNLNNQKIDKLQKISSEEDKASHSKKIDIREKETKINELKSIKDENDETSEDKSEKIVEKENKNNKAVNSMEEKKTNMKIDALIPLPPKPKYSYLKKWLLNK